MGILIEHFGGLFPLWLAPVQVAVLPISEKFNDYAQQVITALRQDNLRVEANLSSDKVGAKIRDASLQKVPYQLIIGEKEASTGEVSVRAMIAGDVGKMTLTEFIQRCGQEIATRGVAHAVKA